MTGGRAHRPRLPALVHTLFSGQGEPARAPTGQLGVVFSGQRKLAALVQSKWDVENSLWFSVIHTFLDLSWELALGGLVTKSFPLHNQK